MTTIYNEMSCLPPHFFSDSRFFPCAYSLPLSVLTDILQLALFMCSVFSHLSAPPPASHIRPPPNCLPTPSVKRSSVSGKLEQVRCHTPSPLPCPIHSQINQRSCLFALFCWRKQKQTKEVLSVRLLVRIQWICLAVVVLTKLKYGKDEQNNTDAMVRCCQNFYAATPFRILIYIIVYLY